MCVFHHNLNTHLVNKSKYAFEKKSYYYVAENGALECYIKLHNDMYHLRLEHTL